MEEELKLTFYYSVLCFSAAKIKKLYNAREAGDDSDWSDEDDQSEGQTDTESETQSDTVSEVSQLGESGGESFCNCSDSSDSSRVCIGFISLNNLPNTNFRGNYMKSACMGGYLIMAFSFCRKMTNRVRNTEW